MKFPVVISLRNDFPIWAMPKGSFLRETVWIAPKFTNMPCAVSGRRYAIASSSSIGPRKVFSIMLNCFGSVNSAPPQFGHLTTPSAFASRWSSRHR